MENTTASSRIKEYDNLVNSASINIEITLKSLPSLLAYRSQVAKELLKQQTEESAKHLKEVYDYTNAKIKHILSID